MIFRLKLAFILLFFPNKLMANNIYFDEGLKLFNSEKFEEAKFKLKYLTCICQKFLRI